MLSLSELLLALEVDEEAVETDAVGTVATSLAPATPPFDVKIDGDLPCRRLS
jgi:hypothetical protein